MKELYLIRHAKSSWDHSEDMEDINRPLALRGLRDARNMSDRLDRLGVRFDKFFASSGIRALHTALIFARRLDLDSRNIEINDKLYLPSRHEIVDVVRGADNQLNCIAVFSHDPGISDFAFHTEARIEHIVTTGILHFKLDTESWKEVSFGNLQFQSYDFPKNTSC